MAFPTRRRETGQVCCAHVRNPQCDVFKLLSIALSNFAWQILERVPGGCAVSCRRRLPERYLRGLGEESNYIFQALGRGQPHAIRCPLRESVPAATRLQVFT